MFIQPDFSEAVELESSPIPPGKYSARITECEQKTSKAGGTYLRWKLVIFGASGDLAKQNNRPFFMNTMVSGKGAGMLKALLAATNTPTTGGFNPETLYGREIQATLATGRNQDGTESNWPEVKAIAPLKH